MYALDTFEVGGTELNAIRTAEQLDRERFDVQFICLARRGALAARVEASGFPVTEFAIGRLVGVQAVATGLRLRRWLRRERIDVVHTHDIYTNIFAIPWARLAGVPLTVASRRWWTETNRPVHVHLNRVSYTLAHRVLANSASVGELVRAEGIAASRIVVVPNFVDEAAFVPPGNDFVNAVHRELGIEPGDVVLGIVANLHAIKDHAMLLEAVAQLVPRHPRLRLVIVGDGAERARLEERTRALEIERHVVFAGRREHHPSMHWTFDISLLASRGEGFPNSVVEAMAAGRPVVSTAVGGVPDVVVDGETGHLTPAGDVGAMAAAIEPLLTDPVRRQALGDAGRRVARERFYADRVVDALGALYDAARRR